MSRFQKATKKQARLRLAIIGTSGCGKTYTSLAFASFLGKRVAVIDSERGSASKYAGIFDFDVLELDSFGPDTYVKAMADAEAEGYDVIVIDSLSHAWMGKDGALERVDKVQSRQKTANSYTAWREVTPQHNALVDAILRSKAHVIATMRAKTEYVLEDDGRGKKVPRKVGLAPVQRDGMEYEFDVVADMDTSNQFVVTKSRCPELTDLVVRRPGKDVADKLLAWLSDGAAVVEPKRVDPPEPVTDGSFRVDDLESALTLNEAETIELIELATKAGLGVTNNETGETRYPRLFDKYHIDSLADLPRWAFNDVKAGCEKLIAKGGK